MARNPASPARAALPAAEAAAAHWHRMRNETSLCSGNCSRVTGNTVYQNQVMGLYTASDSVPRTYLATVRTR